METVFLLGQAAGAERGLTGTLIGLLPMVFLFILFWVMIVVPQRRQAKAHLELVNALKKGDRVVTAGGLIGEVMGIKDEEVQVRSGQSTVVVERARISRVIGK